MTSGNRFQTKNSREMRKHQVFTVLIKIHQWHNKTKVLCKLDENNSSIFTLFLTNGFSKLAVLLMFIKFASGTIKQPFGAI